MKTAIVSDIHGNLDAFEKVLADIDNLQINHIICLGDCIGYGPEPEAVIHEVRKRKLPTIVGNHELAVLDRQHLDWFNPMARSSVEKSIAMLSEASIDFIQQLPKTYVSDKFRCVHGYPPDSVRTYLFQKMPNQLIKSFKAMAEQVCFVGHTHDLEIIDYDGRQVDRRKLPEGFTVLDSKNSYIINVGSVGQPRDGNNNAKYVTYDTDRREIEVRFIAYDIASVVEKIKAAGLPEVHARRLW